MYSVAFSEVLKISYFDQKQSFDKKDFTKFTGKHLRWSLFLMKLQVYSLQIY